MKKSRIQLKPHDHLIVFRDSRDEGAVSAAVGSAGELTISNNDKSKYDLKNYFRIIWPCKFISDALQTVSLREHVSMSIKLPNWQTSGGRPDWGGFLVKRRGETAYRMLRELFCRSSNEIHGDSHALKIEVGGIDLRDEVFFCLHFNELKEACVVSSIAININPINRLHVNKADHSNGILSVVGWARHEKYPGLPIRVELLLDESPVAEVMGKSAQSLPSDAPADAFSFQIDYATSEPWYSKNLSVRIKNTEITEKLRGRPTLVTEGNKAELNEAVSVDGAPEKEIIGKVERFNANEVVGWAVYTARPDIPVELILEIDGVPVAHTKTTRFRNDVKEIHGGSGYAGFYFELPPNLIVGGKANFSVLTAHGHNSIKNSKNEFEGSGKFIISEFELEEPCPKRSSSQETSISAVVLNRNCAELLADLFSSAAEVEPLDRIEWIIVDHASTDDSKKVCEDAKDKGQNILFIRRNGNFSFSESNNFGARYATNNTVAFVNNDLIFRSPFIDTFLDTLSGSNVGIVGSELEDYIEGKSYPGIRIVQHQGVYFKAQTSGKRIRPYESRVSPDLNRLGADGRIVPAVTGALLMVRAEDFREVGGFDERYIYGMEDIDLCLTILTKLKKSSVCIGGVRVIHHRGFSRSKELDVTVRQRNNADLFNYKWAQSLRSTIKYDSFHRPTFWLGRKPIVGFIVVDYGDRTTAGEYFTALELGRALSQILPVTLRFLKEEEWYDLSGVDILIVMVNRFDIRKASNISPFIITFNWTRQWFDRWAADETLYAYDFVFASSNRAREYLANITGIDVKVLRIAANTAHVGNGKPREEFISDYCLTGNKVGTAREIEYQLDSEAINGIGAVFGHNWEDTSLESIARGPVSYADIGDVYASTKIVIDDANIATKDWGSCNSRVFDALAAGRLLITNGKVGVTEIFADLVPTFDSSETLSERLNYWIKNDAERESRAAQLREIVENEHTYAHRAEDIKKLLTGGHVKKRVSVKCAAKYGERHIWGDYHYACSLASALRDVGFTVRVDCIEHWTNSLSETDDVVLVLAGREKYMPVKSQINMLWIISHPGRVAINELDGFDHVFVASHLHCEYLRGFYDGRIEVLLQCTDANLFNLKNGFLDEPKKRPLFVGNSRGIFRQSVKWAVECEADFELYGHGWQQFVSDGRLRGENIPNKILPSYYSRAKFVLCDHWDDMKRFGYVSNRAFDVLACGGYLVVDDVAGIHDVLPGGYSVYQNKNDLADIFDADSCSITGEIEERAEWVLANHSFLCRARVIADRIRHAFEERGTQFPLLQ